MKELADSLKGVKLSSPSGGGGANSDALKSALKAAREAEAGSKEAALAWETVEEIAAAGGDSEATRATLDEECLIELIDGCEALEKFKAALDEQTV